MKLYKSRCFCKQTLDLVSVKPNMEVYASLPLCVIDAVFSIGVRYASTEIEGVGLDAFVVMPNHVHVGIPRWGCGVG